MIDGIVSIGVGDNGIRQSIARDVAHTKDFALLGITTKDGQARRRTFGQGVDLNAHVQVCIAILDVDVHHGNGTQGIFYGRDDVLTISLHADPKTYYPFLCGYDHERGQGAGYGYNRNIPLARTTSDDDYMAALGTAIAHLQAFQPTALVLALGLDAYKDDPLHGMALTTNGFDRIGRAVADIGLPTVVVQEGGYLCDDLGANLTAFMTGFQGAA